MFCHQSLDEFLSSHFTLVKGISFPLETKNYETETRRTQLDKTLYNQTNWGETGVNGLEQHTGSASFVTTQSIWNQLVEDLMHFMQALH